MLAREDGRRGAHAGLDMGMQSMQPVLAFRWALLLSLYAYTRGAAHRCCQLRPITEVKGLNWDNYLAVSVSEGCSVLLIVIEYYLFTESGPIRFGHAP